MSDQEQSDQPRSFPGSRWPRSRQRLAGLILVTLVLGLAAWLLRDVLFGASVEMLEVQRKDLVLSIIAGGRVRQTGRVAVLAEGTGRVARIAFADGQHIQAGDILMELDAAEDQATLAQARATLEETQLRLRQMREQQSVMPQQNAAQAEMQVMQARQQLERSRDLMAKGFVSPAAVEIAQRNLSEAESQWRSTPGRPGAMAGGELAAAQNNIEQARAAMAAAEARVLNSLIRAPVAGTLVSHQAERGGLVQAGKEVMVIEPDGSIEVELRLNMQTLRLIRVGQKAVASVELDEPRRFEAEVSWIDEAADPAQGAAEVRLSVPAPPAGTRSDMAASVRIELDRRLGAVVIPDNALREPDGQPWVLVVVDGKAERRSVKTGLRGDDGVEILEGVEPGDILISVNSTAVKPGDRVRSASAAPVAAGKAGP